jgi:hypothetical protein
LSRIAAVLVVVVAFGLLAAGASAKNAESKKVEQSRAEVLDYWTAEKMRNAKPAPLAKGGNGGGGGKKSTAGQATEVAGPYTGFPTSTNGKVFFTDDGVNYVCSGTAVESQNESVVWTAGHCVNEGPGDFFTNWAFVPAYRDNVRPFGTFTASELHTTPQWSGSGDFSYDLGAAVVSPDSNGTTLTDTVGGGRTLAFGYNRSQRYNSYGYPAANPFNGQRLWMCDSPLYTNDTSASPATMGIQCNMTGGSSGGGWVAGTGSVYSVNSYTYKSLRNVMFGPYQETQAAALLGAADPVS